MNLMNRPDKQNESLEAGKSVLGKREKIVPCPPGEYPFPMTNHLPPGVGVLRFVRELLALSDF